MPFLDSPFQHDVFVSYAHGPNDKLKDWSHYLVNELEDNISSFEIEFSGLIDIFIDRDLDPTRRLTDQLEGKIKGSGLLLVIMSDHYLRSSWCNDELEWFEKELKASQKDGGLILVVRTHPTDHAAWPDCLKDDQGHPFIGFQFHPKPEKNGGIVFPFGWPMPLASDREYYKELGKLSTIVTTRLREIKELPALRVSSERSTNAIPANGQTSIYLQAPASENDIWRLTKEVMEAKGCRVLPEALPDVEGDFKAIQEERKKRLQILNQEAHVLCLLGSRKGNGFDREIETIASDRTSLQAFGKEIPCALLYRGKDNPTLAEELGINVINHDDEDWLDQVKALLRAPAETMP